MHQEVSALCRAQEDTCRNVIYRLIGGYSRFSSALLCWVVEELVFWEWVNLSADASSVPLTADLGCFMSSGGNASLDWEGDTRPVLEQTQ